MRTGDGSWEFPGTVHRDCPEIYGEDERGFPKVRISGQRICLVGAGAGCQMHVAMTKDWTEANDLVKRRVRVTIEVLDG